jgi:DNA-binding NarL/FixJ family response regulator
MIGARSPRGTALSALPEASHGLTALLLCSEGTVPCPVLERCATDAGLEVIAQVGHWTEAVARVAELDVDVAVVDLSLAGSIGVRLIEVLRTADPACEVIALSPLEEIDLAALEAGALEVVQPSDLRPLTAALERLVAAQICS